MTTDNSKTGTTYEAIPADTYSLQEEPYQFKEKDQHFFATNVLGFETDESPIEAINKLRRRTGLFKKSHTMHTALYHVPVHKDTAYNIHTYCPMVEGTTKVWEGEA